MTKRCCDFTFTPTVSSGDTPHLCSVEFLISISGSLQVTKQVTTSLQGSLSVLINKTLGELHKPRQRLPEVPLSGGVLLQVEFQPADLLCIRSTRRSSCVSCSDGDRWQGMSRGKQRKAEKWEGRRRDGKCSSL